MEFQNGILKDGTEVKMVQTVIDSYPNLEVRVATNGIQGGDSGHGGRTYFSILGKEEFDVREVNVLNVDGFSGIEMEIGGDMELETLIQAFRHMADKLEEMK